MGIQYWHAIIADYYLFFTPIPMCIKHCVLSTFTIQVKLHRHNTPVGFELMTFAVLEQISYQ